MEYRFADKLEIGDTIIVSEGNFLNIGFFAGYGKNTIQYYTPSSIVFGHERATENQQVFTPKKHCYKGYVKETLWRLAKVNNPVFGVQQEEIEYQKAKQILTDIKFIKL